MPVRRQFCRILILLALLSVGVTQTRAELFQVYRINVLSGSHVKLEGRKVAIADLTEALAGQVEGEDRIRIKIFMPRGMSKTILERVMAACRDAGASSFFVVHKL